ncbi:MAG: hypothetical protein Q8R76_03195 [Candidatus Omnitrophota bacterium]|nr:hypothetical protein [Candidatus Omnitrophota bacterium]
MSATITLLDEKFETVGEGAIDSRKRISLTKAIDIVHSILGKDLKETRFVIAYNKAGQILLSPEVSIPLHEAWLYKNRPALASVLEGIEEARQGRIKEIGSFAKYADDKIE